MRSLETLVVPVRSVVAHQMFEIPARTEVRSISFMHSVCGALLFRNQLVYARHDIENITYCDRKMHSIAQSLSDISTQAPDLWQGMYVICKLFITLIPHHTRLWYSVNFELFAFINGGANYLFVYHSVSFGDCGVNEYKCGINLHEHFVMKKKTNRHFSIENF